MSGKLYHTVVLFFVCQNIQWVYAPDTDSEEADRGPFDLNELEPELMTPVFKLMRTMGEEWRDAVTAGPKHSVKQFLVIAVMSRSELIQVSKRNQLPLGFSDEFGQNSDAYVKVMNRLVFLLNKKTNINKNHYGSQLHTEVAATDKFLPEALGRFQKGNKDIYPLILMYSHYIPCAGVQKYSCAEELGAFARNKHSQFGVILAFTESYHGTDEQCSRRFLREGGVVLFRFNVDSEGYDRIEDFHPPMESPHNGTLQADLFVKVFSLVSKGRECCIGDEENKKKVVAFFVNEMTYTCLQECSSQRGSITLLVQHQLQPCMEDFIDGMGKDCPGAGKGCSSGALRNSLKKRMCDVLKNAAEKHLLFGRPPGTSDDSIYSSIWKPFDGPWSYLYRKAPSEEARSLPRVECANRILSKKSLCTKIKDSRRGASVSQAVPGSPENEPILRSYRPRSTCVLS